MQCQIVLPKLWFEYKKASVRAFLQCGDTYIEKKLVYNDIAYNDIPLLLITNLVFKSVVSHL
jgi:hypothetical protein